jgi:hypothetical protein
MKKRGGEPLTPEEKWKRLNNPTSAEDYGLSLSRDELLTFSEGQQMVAMVLLRSTKNKRGNHEKKNLSGIIMEK